MRLTIEVADEQVRLEVDDESIETGPLDSDSPLESIQALLKSHESLTTWQPSWALRIGYPWAQIRTVRGLPPVKERILSRIVEERAAIIFRGAPERLLFDASWEDTADGVARAASVERSLLAGLVSLAHAHGAIVESVAVTGLAAERSATFRHAILVRHERGWLARRAFKALGVALLPWIAAGTLFVGDLNRDARDLALRVDSLQVAESRLTSIEDRVYQAAGIVEQLQQPGERKAAWVSQIADLTTVLPENQSLSRLDLAPDRASLRVELSGTLSPATRSALQTLFPGWEAQTDSADSGLPGGRL